MTLINKNIMKNLPYDYFYLGFALSAFSNVQVMDWEFYAIIIPFIFLETFRNYRK